MTQTTRYEDFPGAISSRANGESSVEKKPYISPVAMASEWEQVWTRTWLFAGVASDLEEPGDYIVFEIGRESIVVVCTQRAEGGEGRRISAFYNVCQHRGNRILTSAAGSVSEFSCPYHGWRYSLEGELQHVPDLDRFSQGVPVDERSLKPVQVQVWAGLLWVNMDPTAPPLTDFLGPILDQLAPYHFENMVLAKQQTVTLGANWKTAKDNFLEQYHVDFIHPQHASLVDCCNSSNVLWPFGHSATMVEGYTTDSRYPVPHEVPAHLVPMLRGLGLDPADFDGRVASIRRAVQQQKRLIGEQLGFDYSPLSDDQVSDVWQYDLFPNLFMTVQAEELWIFGPRPHPSDPDKCFFDKWTLQVPREVASDVERGLYLNPGLVVSRDDERPEPEFFSEDQVIAREYSMTITIDQDIHYLRDMQAGMHSRGFDRAWLNQDEGRVQHFHDWLEQWLRSNPTQ